MRLLFSRSGLAFALLASATVIPGCVASDTGGPADGTSGGSGGTSAGGSGGVGTSGTGGTSGASATTGGSSGTGGFATGGSPGGSSGTSSTVGGTAGSSGTSSTVGGTAGSSGTSSTVGGTAGSGGAATGGAGVAGSSTGGSAGTSAGSGGSGGLAGGGAGTAGQNSGGAGGSAGSAGTPGGLCPSNAVFCEDFEDGNLDGWTKNESGGTLVVNTAKPSHGTSSLQVDVAAMQYGGSIIRKGAPLFPLPNQRMFGRLMIYFDTIADGHTDFIRGAATNGATPQYNIAEQHGEILLNYYNGSSSDCWARPMPGKDVPLKTWMCWEWSFDGATNQMQFYIDGTLSRQVDGTGDGCLSNPTQTWTAPTFAELRIGEYVAERSPDAQRIWIDDIAVGTNGRIACPGP